jgi:arylsulfatase
MTPTRAPNVLWICTDQQRWDTLGCYGNSFVRTPHLDGLAASGVVFDHAYVQSTVCTPSRASFLTGRYPRTTRVRQNGQAIPRDEVLVTRQLADAGYICGLAGKLHLAPAHPSVAAGIERRIDDGYAELHWSHQPGDAWPTNQYMHWLRERGVRYETTPFSGSGFVHSGVAAEDHQTTWCAQKAIDFIEANAASSADHPWLFSVNIYDPHHPFDPPPECLERYADRLDDIPLPNFDPRELDAKPSFQRIDHEGAYGGKAGYRFARMTDVDHRWLRAAYWAMCDLIDVQVGRILETLERTGQAGSTLVIFMSDHGELLGDHGIYLKGPHFYEPAIRVPLIVSWPDQITPARRVAPLVELVDLAPTLLDAAGLPRHPGMQGRSLLPYLIGAPDLEARRGDVYCEYYNAMPWHEHPTAHATMVRTRDHKLVSVHGARGADEVGGELYDLGTDPLERHNRWTDPACAAVKSDLLELLCDRMAWTGDPLPPREAMW